MLDLRKLFGRACVLNLDSRPERYANFLERSAPHFTGITRYRAISGTDCPPPAWWGAGEGAWGCLMSHLRIAQDALMDNLPSYVVFEDDAVFSGDASARLAAAMDQLTSDNVEWDMLYLGGQHLYTETSPPWPFRRPGLVRCNNVNRTHGYAINRRFMQRFVQHILHAPDYIERSRTHPEEPFHLDHQLGQLHRHHLTLAVHPWICGQAGGPSDINVDGNFQEQWWLDEGWNK